MNNADYWNGIIREHAEAQARVAGLVTPAPESPKPETYRGWAISWDYGEYSATGPNYDASWEGEEDGWVDNGERVFAKTLPELREEVDAYIEEHGE